MAILVGRHLTKSQHGVLTAQTVVVGLLARVGASLGGARLAGGVFFKARSIDRVELLVLPPMSHHFVGIRADKVTFDAVEVGSFVLDST